MLKRNPLHSKIIAALHNGFLSLGSLALLLLIVQELYPKIIKKGYMGSLCDKDIMTNQLEFYCYLNYLLKYYELSDTLLLVLKKKDIPFLHTYHHTMTLILTHVELVGNVAVQWVPISLNLFVHVLMYFYYMLATLGYEIWWKKYLTSLQIIQFVIDLIACFSALFYKINYPNDCHGDYWQGFVGIFIIASYLFLFLDFFVKTYPNQREKKTDTPVQTNKNKKKKDIPFLHTYHHTMTLILTHVELVGNVSVQWVPISLNLFVHVLMYFYYMLATLGYEIWWKKYLTTLQIIQFVIDLIACFSALTSKIYYPNDCHGDYWQGFVGVSIIGSYLFLFLDFFR
jgi:hypothetical protein